MLGIRNFFMGQAVAIWAEETVLTARAGRWGCLKGRVLVELFGGIC
jgi:hypothetical protein